MGTKNGVATVEKSLALLKMLNIKGTSDQGIVLLGIQLALRISETFILGYGGLTVTFLDFHIQGAGGMMVVLEPIN